MTPINALISSQVVGQPKPEVGMGITIYWWSDRNAGTISRVSASGKTFWYRNDQAIRTDRNGLSESQTYEFVPCPECPESKVSLRKDGRWKTAGGRAVRLGERDAYHDPSF